MNTIKNAWIEVAENARDSYVDLRSALDDVYETYERLLEACAGAEGRYKEFLGVLENAQYSVFAGGAQ